MTESERNLLHQFIHNAFIEDVGDGDHTSLATIPAGLEGKARLIVKDDGILAGIELALEIFKIADPGLYVDVIIPDGSPVKHQDIAFIVQGSVHSILRSERIVLNCMQRMSGIATLTASVVSRLKGSSARILDTRKTTPGFRYMEKWAVALGGGVNHRFGLYDMILIKDNHVDFAGGIVPALDAVRHYLSLHKKELKIVIEVRNLQELEEVLENGPVERILLDNFALSKLREAVHIVNNQVDTEASGGITPENVLDYANCGVDYISLGALTHSVPNFDLSLKAFT